VLISKGLLALPGAEELRRASIRVEGGTIAEISESLSARAGEELVDASELIVLPGAVDPHVHFDEPGFTHREDFLHGTAEAARCGVTTVIDMPCTSMPPVIDVAALRNKLSYISRGALVDYALYGGVSGQSLEASLGPGGSGGSMEELATEVVGFKCYFISGMDSFSRVEPADLARVLAKAARLGRPVLLHAEDYEIVTQATARLKAARAGEPYPWSDYADSRPESAEIAAVSRAVELAGENAKGLHIVHVATAAAAEIAHRAGATCETCAHYLAFGREDFAEKGAALKTAPVVKGRSERELLWRLLSEGKIDFAASDHAPSTREEKETGNPWTAYGGIPGVGTNRLYLLSEGLLARRLSLARFLEAAGMAAARRYGLSSRKGSLEKGKDADIVLVDPEASTRVEGAKLLSKGKITPFEGMSLRGEVLATYVRGHLAYDAAAAREGKSGAAPDLPGILAEPGSGKFLSWGRT